MTCCYEITPHNLVLTLVFIITKVFKFMNDKYYFKIYLNFGQTENCFFLPIQLKIDCTTKIQEIP